MLLQTIGKIHDTVFMFISYKSCGYQGLEMHLLIKCRHDKLFSALVKLGNVPGVTQALVELLGNGASHRIFRKFIESSYFTLEPERLH